LVKTLATNQFQFGIEASKEMLISDYSQKRRERVALFSSQCHILLCELPAGRGSRRGGSPSGSASMDEDKQRAIASQGGKASHESGKGHELSSEEARAAVRKGGEASGGGNRGG
jgi:general stress protein YciG